MGRARSGDSLGGCPLARRPAAQTGTRFGAARDARGPPCLLSASELATLPEESACSGSRGSTSYRPVDHKLLGKVETHPRACSAHHLAQNPYLAGTEDPADNQPWTFPREAGRQRPTWREFIIMRTEASIRLRGSNPTLVAAQRTQQRTQPLQTVHTGQSACIYGAPAF